jgi:hypothetical protein
MLNWPRIFSRVFSDFNLYQKMIRENGEFDMPGLIAYVFGT